MKASALASLAAAVGLAVALAACGNSPGSYTPVQVNAVPPGYQLIGGVGQGLYLAVPQSWTVIDLAAQTPTQAFMALLLKTDNSAVLAQTENQLGGLAPVHAVYAVDLQSAASSPGQYATNVSAFCNKSGTSQSGRAGLPFLRRQALHLGDGARDIRPTGIRLGTVPGLEVTYAQNYPAAGTLYGTQLVALPSPGRVCLITVDTSGALPGGLLAKVARSVQYI